MDLKEQKLSNQNDLNVPKNSLGDYKQLRPGIDGQKRSDYDSFLERNIVINGNVMSKEDQSRLAFLPGNSALFNDAVENAEFFGDVTDKQGKKHAVNESTDHAVAEYMYGRGDNLDLRGMIALELGRAVTENPENIRKQFLEGVGDSKSILGSSKDFNRQLSFSNDSLSKAIENKANRQYYRNLTKIRNQAEKQAYDQKFNRLAQASQLVSQENQLNEQKRQMAMAKAMQKDQVRGQEVGQILGIVGAVVGGVAGGPAGATAGYSVGSGVGQAAGQGGF